MQLEELPTPASGPTQALVRVHAASVNFLDIQKRRGELVGQAFDQSAGRGEPEFPANLGSQGVGVVEALGPEVNNVRVGDRVSFWGNSYATHCYSNRAPARHTGWHQFRASGGRDESGIFGVRVHAFCLSSQAGRLVSDPGSRRRDRSSALSDGEDSRGDEPSALPPPRKKQSL
jgi:threonine dehydrogenase-like Zn-dependent dehydrogenase